MNEDQLLRALGHLAREEERAERARLDERWDRLAAGTLTADEEAELRALAETSPEARQAWEAFRPLGPEFQARVAEKITEERKVLPFRRPAVRIGGWIAAAAAAAAIAVVLLRPAAPLPGYQIAEVSGGSSETRGEPAASFSPGDRIEVVLRPDTASRGDVEARLFLLQKDELRPLDVQSMVDPGGSVKLDGLLPDLQPGTWTLWAVVGRPGDLPDPTELRSRGGPNREEDWVAVSQDILIRPRDP